MSTVAAPATLSELVTTVVPHLYRGPPPGNDGAAEAEQSEAATVQVEKFSDPIDLANLDPGTQYLKAFIDFNAHMKTNFQRRAQASRTPEEKARVHEETAADYKKTASLLATGTDHLGLFGAFYSLGEYERIAETIPTLQIPSPMPTADSIPKVSRSHITKYMQSYCPNQGTHVRRCANWRNCIFRALCRSLDHPDPVRRGDVYMPGRAFLLPTEEANPDFDEPRMCYFCQIMTMNVTYEANQRRGEAKTIVNNWGVIVNAVGEYTADGVRTAFDGSCYGLIGSIPGFNTHRFNCVEASDPDGPYGFVDTTPFFGERESACRTSL